MTNAPKVELIPLDDLTPYSGNAKTHPAAQIDEIKASIREFGFTVPILADLEDAGLIAAGHGRLIALRELFDAEEDVRLVNGETLPPGLAPVVDCSRWTPDQRRAYTLADNKLTENGEWNEEILRAELNFLSDAAPELVEKTGFSAAEIRDLMRSLEGDEAAEKTPEPPEDPVTEEGDLWVLGDHRLLCGDSTDADAVDALLDGAVPHLMVTDPPYGVEYDPNWRNKADRANGKPYGASAVGKVRNDDRADWREAWALFPGDVAYVWHAGIKAGIVAESLEACGFDIRAQIVWAKTQFVIGRGHYHIHHEPCWYAVKKGGTCHWGGSRKESTLWQIEHRKSETGHGTQKPVECMRRPIVNNSVEGDAVYEPFSGSGTTIIAGEIEGRRVYAMEFAPEYVDVAVLRWQDFTGKVPVLEETGETFEEVKRRRDK